MGQQIVYCGTCGTSLRRDDFAKGKALEVDAIPYCVACLPASAAGKLAPRSDPTRSSISSTKIRALAPSTPRRTSPGKPRTSTPLWIAAGAGALAVVVASVLLSGGSPPPPPPPPAPTPARPSSSPAAEAWARLDGFAQAAEPEAVLMRCEEAANALRGSPFESRLRELEERTREKIKQRQLTQSIDEARKFAQSDARFRKPEEFRRLLDRLLATPGAHQPEIRRISDAWEKERAELAVPPPPPPPPSSPPASAEPRSLGPEGEVRDWLVLGSFANTPDNQGLYQNPLLGEEVPTPAEGLELARRDGGKLAWIRHAAPDGTVDFRRVPALGAAGSTAPAIAYAACWLIVDVETKIKFRVNADTGCLVLHNGERIANIPGGHEIGKEPQTYVRTLVPGANLVVVKAGTAGGPHRLRFRVTTTGGLTEPAPGVSVKLDPPSSRVLFRESFDGSVGRFSRGSLRENALAFTSEGAAVDKPLSSPVRAGTTLRFRYKALAAATGFSVLAWSQSRKLNHWYHFQDVRPDDWRSATVLLRDLKGGYNRDGPSLEGEIPENLTFSFEGPAGVTILIDDVEILE